MGGQGGAVGLARAAWQKGYWGLGVSCVAQRGKTLLDKQFCHQVAKVGGFPSRPYGRAVSWKTFVLLWLGADMQELCQCPLFRQLK